jgi:dihydropteroate synthase
MGILNVTPDSFSDGGKFFDTQSAIDQALRIEDSGAGILDIGGESTRPYSEPVSTDEELKRVLPVLEAIVERIAIPISIDTSKSAVARAAIEVGVEIINDISGLTNDPAMKDVAIESNAAVCAMHMQGTPMTMQDDPRYENIVDDILAYLVSRDRDLIAAGIAVSKICLDPGIGFGKTHADNLELLRSAHLFHQTGRPLLVGHSRKGFIAKVIGDKSCDRMPGGIGVSIALALNRIQILRVHDVKATQQALMLFEQSGGLDRS